MLQPILEPAWVNAFEAVLSRCALQRGDTVAVLTESQTRPELPQLARIAASSRPANLVGSTGSGTLRKKSTVSSSITSTWSITA